MNLIRPNQITDVLRAFFKVEGIPGSLRFQALLAGDIDGKVWTDNPTKPTWGILQDTYGTLHFEGSFPHDMPAEFIKERQQDGEVLYGFWDGANPMEGLLPPAPYDGRVWESDMRQASVNLDQLISQCPPDCQLRKVDAGLFEQVLDKQFYSDMFGSPARALEKLIAYCLMRGDEILCEAYAGTAYDDRIEMGVTTREAHIRKGYATVTCAAVIREAEQHGYRTYWNCAAQNIPSIALAHRLGYAPMKQYRLLAWF